MASQLGKDLIYMIMQFLDEEKYKDVLHKLEEGTGLYFNVRHFEELAMDGKYVEIENYLSGFTKFDDNRYSMKMYFELRKHKYLEALDSGDRAKAVEILVKDLKVFAPFHVDLFNEMTQLIPLDNFREHQKLSGYQDTRHSRTMMMNELKMLIEANPLLKEKLQFPTFRPARLRMLVNQSLNWQHSLCPNPKQNPEIRTLLVDHICRNSGESNNQLTLASSHQSRIALSFLPLGPNSGSFQQQNNSAALRTWMSTHWNHFPMSHQPTSGPDSLFNPAEMITNVAPVDTAQTAVRQRSLMMANTPSQNMTTPVPNWDDEFPKRVARILTQGSNVTTMDFHPTQQTLLLVGTSIGEISLWEVSSTEKLATRSFQVGLVKDQSVSVKKVSWTPDGSLLGAAFSMNVVHIYRYHGGNDLRKYLEIEAHVGSVNDLAFNNIMGSLCVITCGDDMLIKVWEVGTGQQVQGMRCHSAPVISLLAQPQTKEDVKYMYSTSMDGKIIAWILGKGPPRIKYEAQTLSCTKLAISSDGKRVFFCGATKEGMSRVVEWDEADRCVKRSYQGFHKNSSIPVQFEVTKNKYLAVGDDNSIKVWDIDNVNLLTAIDCDGELPASPRIRFNRDGSLMAVSANENSIKILATLDGFRLMCGHEKFTFVAPRNTPEASSSAQVKQTNGAARKVAAEESKQRLVEEVSLARIWKLVESYQIQSLKLTAPTKVEKISRLLFTNSGNSLLALTSNGVHLLWKWPPCDQNPTGKATTKMGPQFMEPAGSGSLMTNEVMIHKSKSDDSLSCMALSKNDCYIISASGGRISLFNLLSFKTMTTFMGPPPAVTCLLFHPQDNNMVALGMDDSTVHIYNVRTDEIKKKLIAHKKRITGLAFSEALKMLVSSGADSQIVTWSSTTWEKQGGSFLNVPGPRSSSANSNTQVHFHSDHTQILVVHDVQISIHAASTLDCINQWVAGESSAPVLQAMFSSDSKLVYAIFGDASIRVFGAANLNPMCLISPGAYLPPPHAPPRALAPHPHEPNLLAVGLADGTVLLLSPLDSHSKWGPLPLTPSSPILGDPPSSTADAPTSTVEHVADSETRQPMTLD